MRSGLSTAGFFHFIEPAPITPSRQLKIDRKTKVEASGDFDTKVQACSAPMLSTIAEDTKAAMALLPADQRFLFFGSTTDQCDAQVAAHKAAGLNVESYHNNMSAAAQDSVIARFRAGEIRGLCTVSKVNRGFDCPAVSLVVVGFGTASRSKYEQICGRAQRVFAGKTAAWVLDYGGHGQRFGSANWDYVEAIKFDRREKLRVPAAELAAQIAFGKHDPKCEVRPDNFMDLTEATVDLFNVIVKPSRNGQGAVLYYVHSLGYTGQYVHANITRTIRFLRFFVPEYQTAYTPPPSDGAKLIQLLGTADLPSHLMLRRVYDAFLQKIKIAPVGFRRDDDEYLFDDECEVITEKWLRDRAHSRLAYAEPE
jgi:hypothetical protein